MPVQIHHGPDMVGREMYPTLPPETIARAVAPKSVPKQPHRRWPIIDYIVDCLQIKRPRPSLQSKGLRSAVWALEGVGHRRDDRLPGRCWHCGVALPATGWHVDHHPIPWRLISTQACCGITDGKDLSNLVPSCARCNEGHQHELSTVPWNYVACTLQNRARCCVLLCFALMFALGVVILLHAI